MNIPKTIILHHSATADGGSTSWGAIRRYHMDVNGWGAIAYHFGIERIDDAAGRAHYEVLMGRMPNESGAHCVGQNSQSLGVCIVGNYDLEPPPVPIWGRALVLVRWLCVQFKIRPVDVVGHRDFANKTCPGTAFDLGKFRADLEL